MLVSSERFIYIRSADPRSIPLRWEPSTSTLKEEAKAQRSRCLPVLCPAALRWAAGPGPSKHACHLCSHLLDRKLRSKHSEVEQPGRVAESLHFQHSLGGRGTPMLKLSPRVGLCLPMPLPSTDPSTFSFLPISGKKMSGMWKRRNINVWNLGDMRMTDNKRRTSQFITPLMRVPFCFFPNKGVL